MAKKIRIIRTPPGSLAPESIRKEWVGIEIPLAPNGDEGDHWVGEENAGGYVVNTKDAIEALRKAGKKEAVDFWEEVEHMTGNQLRFSADFCSLI